MFEMLPGTIEIVDKCQTYKSYGCIQGKMTEDQVLKYVIRKQDKVKQFC